VTVLPGRVTVTGTRTVRKTVPSIVWAGPDTVCTSVIATVWAGMVIVVPFRRIVLAGMRIFAAFPFTVTMRPLIVVVYAPPRGAALAEPPMRDPVTKPRPSRAKQASTPGISARLGGSQSGISLGASRHPARRLNTGKPVPSYRRSPHVPWDSCPRFRASAIVPDPSADWAWASGEGAPVGGGEGDPAEDDYLFCERDRSAVRAFRLIDQRAGAPRRLRAVLGAEGHQAGRLRLEATITMRSPAS
jgi:hypothetical protein